MYRNGLACFVWRRERYHASTILMRNCDDSVVTCRAQRMMVRVNFTDMISMTQSPPHLDLAAVELAHGTLHLAGHRGLADNLKAGRHAIAVLLNHLPVPEGEQASPASHAPPSPG